MENDPDYKYWSYSTYRPISICPAVGYKAVFACECEDNPELHELVAFDVPFMAVAEVTHRSVRRHNSSRVYENIEILEEDVRNDFVALIDGEFGLEIANEACSFVVLCRDGDDLKQFVGLVDQEKFPLKQE